MTTRRCFRSTTGSGFGTLGSGLHALVAAAVLAGCAVNAGPLATPAPTQATAPSATAGNRSPEAGAGLVAFASDEGLARLARSTAKADFAVLANQFEPQSNAAFCGPTSAAIVLNALLGRGSAGLPRDRSRLQPDDWKHLADGADPSLPRYTQETVIGAGMKTRARVLGEPVPRGTDGRTARDFGYQLRQFDQMLRGNGATTRLVVVDAARPETAIRAELVQNLQRSGDYVIVNYRRELVGQTGGGHISPLGAYDAASDSVLVLDVNPTAAGWVWMPLATLVAGMRSFDTVENRGYLLVGER
jgi:Phytochelatin synthase